MFDLVWYKNLIQPSFAPSPLVFPPVWAFLYFTLLIAIIIYGMKPYVGKKNWGYVIFFCQLALNLCWSPIFFIFHNIGMAFVLIIIMIIFTILNIIEFYKVSKTSGLILIPYLLWLLFAAYLNAGIFLLN